MSENGTNDITELRGELFATIRALRDKDNPMDVSRAKAVADVAGRIIESAKAETEFVKAFGMRGAVPASGFIGLQPKGDTLDHQGASSSEPRKHVTTDASGRQVVYETREDGKMPPAGPTGRL